MEEAAVPAPSYEPGAVRTGAARWSAARVAVKQEVRAQALAKDWHGDVDRMWKRLCLSCMQSHTLCAGILYRGVAGYTRSQTVMILLNSLGVESVVLLMFFAAPSAPDPACAGDLKLLPSDEAAACEASNAMVINPVNIIVAGTEWGKQRIANGQ